MEASSRRGRRRRRMNMLSFASCYGLFIGIRFVSFRLCHIFIRYFYSEASSRRRFKFGCTKFLLIIISAAPAILCGMDGVQEVLCIFYTERNFGSVEIPKSICVRTFSMALIMFAKEVCDMEYLFTVRLCSIEKFNESLKLLRSKLFMCVYTTPPLL